jgi:hypothetical protein
MNTTPTTAVVTPFTQNNHKQQKQTAKEVIAANVQALIEQLEQGHSEALTAYLTAMGRLHPPVPRQRRPAHRELGSDPEDLRPHSRSHRKPRSRDSR